MTDAFVRFQKLLPQHAVSRFVGKLAASRSPLFARPFIRLFSNAYGVSLADARRKRLEDYTSFNDFFMRELAPGARPMPVDSRALVSPADGTVSQTGPIEAGALIQAKGIRYETHALLDDATMARVFDNGWFATIYLAPSNYHRVHVPYDGILKSAVGVPGSLFSVNSRTEAAVTGLFHRNERLVCMFDTEFGPLAVVMVGALIVASIETDWAKLTSPYRNRQVEHHDRAFARGQELGRFCLGSTVVLLVPAGAVSPLAEIVPGRVVRMGETLARVTARKAGR